MISDPIPDSGWIVYSHEQEIPLNRIWSRANGQSLSSSGCCGHIRTSRKSLITRQSPTTILFSRPGITCMPHHKASVVERLKLRELTVHDHALMERSTGFTTSCHSGFDKHYVTGGMKV